MSRRSSRGRTGDVAIAIAIALAAFAALAMFVKMLKMSLFGNLVAIAYIIACFMSEWMEALDSIWWVLILLGGLLLIKLADTVIMKAMGYL